MLTSGGSHPKAIEACRAWLYAGRTSATTNLQKVARRSGTLANDGGAPLLGHHYSPQAKRPGEQTVVSYRVSTRRVGRWPIHR
jgi:hypothetical protein